MEDAVFEQDRLGSITEDGDAESNSQDDVLGHENEELRDRVSSLEKKVQLQDDEIVCLKSALSDALRRLSLVESARSNNLLPSMPHKMSARLTGPAPTATSGKDSSQSAKHGNNQSNSSARPILNNTPPRLPSPALGKTAQANQGHSMKKWPSSPSTNATNDAGNALASVKVSSNNDSRTTPTTNHSTNPPVRTAPGYLRPTKDISVDGVPGHLKSTKDPVDGASQQTDLSSRRSSSLASLPMNRPSRTSLGSTRQKDPSYNSADGCLKFYLRGRPLNFYVPTASAQDFQLGPTISLPKEKLALEWVYGYRGRDARSNIYLLPTGEIVYFIAAVAVLFNPEEQMQRHYIGHTDDIKCLAVHPDRVTIATGQVAGHDKVEGKLTKRRDSVEQPVEFNDFWTSAKKKDKKFQPHIRIWNSISLATLKVIGIGEFERAVACIGFSKVDGGTFLAAVDDANEHVISVWDWQKSEKGHKVTETKSSTDPVLTVEYHPCEPNVIISCGKGQICFWTLEGATLTRKFGIFEKHEKPKYMTCLAFAENGDVISGDSTGTIFIWGRGTNKVQQAVAGAHDGSIFTICTMKDGSIITGGKDKKIIRWEVSNGSYKKAGQEYEVPEVYGPVRMLSQGKGSNILVGTTKNAMLQGSFDLKFSPIVQGHMEELWGLAVHPNQNQFITCGYDKSLYLWDTLTHSVIWNKEMPDGCHCATFHPEGQIVVVGGCATRWFAVDLTSRDVVTTHSDSTERIECMEFSPNGLWLACGSRDNNIYVYAVSEGGRKYTKAGKCSGHSSFLTHLDWSTDNQFIQSNSGDYELLYWNVSNWRQVTSSSTMRDVEWATQNCVLGFNVCGIWPEGADGTDVNTCSRSHRQHLVASGNDFGKVTLFSYPCFQPKSPGHVYSGHSSHVTNVQFLYDDSRLISLGGKDSAIMQWQVVDQGGF